jgi:sporulation protein YlmC with PRC-barrel domain
MQTKPQILSSTSITSDKVVNDAGEDLGKMEDLMIDIDAGQIAYAVVSFGGLFGNKLFAVPWSAFQISFHDKKFVLNVPKEELKNAPGFDKDNWPEQPDMKWLEEVYRYYGCDPYWPC